MNLEKMRQCEVHMAQPKRDNCCRAWLSKFPTRYGTFLTNTQLTPKIFPLKSCAKICTQSICLLICSIHNFYHFLPIENHISYTNPLIPHQKNKSRHTHAFIVLLVVCSCSLASFTSFCSKQIKLVVVIVARTQVVDFVVVCEFY